MHNEHRIPPLYEELARKRLEGTITPPEADELARWLNSDDGLPLEIPADRAESRSAHEARLLADLRAQMASQITPQMAPPSSVTPVVSLRRNFGRLAAAAVMLILLTGSYLYFTKHKVLDASLANQPQKERTPDLMPGTTKATLVLDDGRQIVLDTVRSGLVANQGTTSINTRKGALEYAGGRNGRDGRLFYNMLITHKGEQYPLILSDGTKLIVDAATTVRYPAVFGNRDRTVEINGRAWLEVAKDPSRPFYVVKGGHKVQVLGTSFDVNAYDNEPGMKVTLVEGSIRVSSGAASELILPGEQAVIGGQNDQIRVIRKADVEEATAWKNGRIVFHDADMATILRAIERWYNVDVSIQGPLPERKFYFEVSRTAPLSELAQVFSIYHIHCSIDVTNRKLTVNP